MILAFVAAALALEPAFECEPLTEPADGLKYANPGELSGAVYDRLLAWAEAQYEDDCPLRCEGGGDEDCAYSDDCVTSVGTWILVEYAYTWRDYSNFDESRALSVQTDSGTSLTLTSYQHTYWVYGGGVVSGTDLTWDASWAGAPDPALPGEATVVVSVVSVDNGDWPNANEGVAEDWQDGTCAWSASYNNSGYYGYYTDAWNIAVGEQALRVAQAWCGGETATLDGLEHLVDTDTWELATDVDADGAPADVDCDDDDPARSPCFAEVSCDGLDNNCDSTDDDDHDGDGHTAECAGGDDCDDDDADVHPGARDHANNLRDEDCDGADSLDGDGDGAAPSSAGGDDCNDDNRWIFPGARDTYCDGIDQNCDGEDACPEEPKAWDEDDMPPVVPGCRWNESDRFALLLLVTFGHARRRRKPATSRIAP